MKLSPPSIHSANNASWIIAVIPMGQAVLIAAKTSVLLNVRALEPKQTPHMMWQIIML
jgi:hypothetical protein